MKRIPLLLSSLLIGIASTTTIAKSNELSDSQKDFLRSNIPRIIQRLECLRVGGATDSQAKEYMFYLLKKYNISLEQYQQALTDNNISLALNLLNSVTLKTRPEFCKHNQLNAFLKSKDAKYSSSIAIMENTYQCLLKLKRSKEGVTDRAINLWLADRKAEGGINSSTYQRVLSDKLYMPTLLDKIRGYNCKKEYMAGIINEFLKYYVDDIEPGKAQENGAVANNLGNTHEQCKDARDYQGCMNYKRNASSKNSQAASSSSEDYCPKKLKGWCIAGDGRDRFGLKKLKGWEYLEMESGSVLYKDPVAKRVPHKGQPHRYVAFITVTRYLQAPTAGTPGSYNTIGNATTNCTGYGSMINCTTTPATKIYIPGTSGSAGGFKSRKEIYVSDCQDGTYAFYDYETRKIRGRWKKIEDWESRDKTLCRYSANYPVMEMDL